MNPVINVAKTFDFHTPLTPRSQAQFFYAATILARLAFVRGEEEFRETLTRDIPGFCGLFFISAVIENTLGYILDKISPASNASEGFTLIKGPEKKSLLRMLNPFSKHKVRSFEDIEALKEIIKPQNYKELLRNKTIVFLAGLATSIAALGVIIPRLNVLITRKSFTEGNQHGTQPAKHNFSSKLNLTPTPNLKPNGVHFNRFS